MGVEMICIIMVWVKVSAFNWRTCETTKSMNVQFICWHCQHLTVSN